MKTVKELRKLTGMTQVEFGKWYHIPYRTVQNWEGNVRKPNETVLYLLNRAVMDDLSLSLTRHQMSDII